VELMVAEVVTAVDESVDATRCGGEANCHGGERCLTHDLWMDLSEQIHDFLSSISLGDLMERGGIRQVAERQDRKITQVAVGTSGRSSAAVRS
jgi:Rrf2 family iron-sulfur cluster assembly transcriptional regulator